MTLVKLTGGPCDGEEVTIQDENHLTVLYPGYTPTITESNPDEGMVTVAEWSGDEVQAASYENRVDNPDVSQAEQIDQTGPTATEQGVTEQEDGDQQVADSTPQDDTGVLNPTETESAHAQEDEEASAEPPAAQEGAVQESGTEEVPAGQ